jgi:hypothetical protein
MSDERDAQIARMIRNKIGKVETERERLGYRIGSPEDACLQGQMMGLRMALAFVDPHPQC